MSDKRTIVITGTSRGLGRAMTAGFVELGHTVIGCSRSAEAVVQLLDDFGPPNSFEVVDVSDDAQVGSWASSVLAEIGPPDILINSAAVMNESAPLWEVPADEFSHLVDVNIKGVYHGVRHFVPAMIERGSGLIVNFSSYWGRTTSSDVAPYCATKWAIEGLTRSLASELPSGLAAVAFNPGIINTDMLQTCFGSGASSYPSPAKWAKSAIPFILELGEKHNGTPVTVPGF